MSDEELESDFDELPEPAPRRESGITGGMVPVGVPPAIYRLKRSSDVVSGNGKRQKVFHSQGVTHYVDDDLLPEPDSDGEEEDEMNDEERARYKENQEHALRSAQKVMLASMTHTHTPGSKRMARTMAKQRATYDDVRWKIVNDEEGFGWHPVPSPQIHRQHKFIGPKVNNADTECYGCTRGIGIERVNLKVINDLREFIMDSYGRMEMEELCSNVSIWFEENIRQRFNANIKKGENAIAPWTPQSVYAHIHDHCDEATFLHFEMLRALKAHFRIVRDNSLYKAKSEALNSGRELSVADIHPNPGGHKMMLETIKAITELERQDPKDFYNYNPKLNIAKSLMGAVASKQVPSIARLQTKSIYDPAITGI